MGWGGQQSRARHREQRRALEWRIIQETRKKRPLSFSSGRREKAFQKGWAPRLMQEARGRVSKQGNHDVGGEGRTEGLTNWGHHGTWWEGSGEGEGWEEVWRELLRWLVTFWEIKAQYNGNWVKFCTLGHAGEQLRPNQPLYQNNAETEGKDNKEALTEWKWSRNELLFTVCVHSFRPDMVLTLSSKQWYRTSYNIYLPPCNGLDFPFIYT